MDRTPPYVPAYSDAANHGIDLMEELAAGWDGEDYIPGPDDFEADRDADREMADCEANCGHCPACLTEDAGTDRALREIRRLEGLHCAAAGRVPFAGVAGGWGRGAADLGRAA